MDLDKLVDSGKLN